jgi:glycosyltransferase involved in cell wall biosynthesis
VHVAVSLLTLVPGEVGGTETYARALIRAYAAGAGPERVTVLAGPETARSLEGGAVEVFTVPYAPGRGTAARAAGLARGLLVPPVSAKRSAANADVVHFPLTVPIPRAPVPAVVSLHDVLHLDIPSVFSAAERAYRHVAYDRPARSAARVMTASEHARGRIAARLGIPPDRIDVIAHGIDHVRFSPSGDDDALAGVPLPPNPFVLYPANLWPHKNHERLVAALARTDPALQLVLTGSTYGRLEALRSAAERHGVRDRVHHLGYVAPAAVAPLYRRARALVFPSLYEGFGAPPLEAMACGCPVAASDAGAVAEICGAAALSFAAGDVAAMAGAIDRVVTEDGLREQLRAAGLERASAYTWERSAAGHAEAYEAARALSSAVRRRPRRPATRHR